MKKHLYFTIVLEKDGKHFAFAQAVSTTTNLLYAFPNKNIAIIQYCETKKEASETAERWNDDFRENGTYSIEAAV